MGYYKPLGAAVVATAIRTFARVDTSMSSETRGLEQISEMLRSACKGLVQEPLTSAKRFPQLSSSHICGFSPVWVRMCTVRALRWMKHLPHHVHVYGRSFLWMRSCLCRSDLRLKP